MKKISKGPSNEIKFVVDMNKKNKKVLTMPNESMNLIGN